MVDPSSSSTMMMAFSSFYTKSAASMQMQTGIAANGSRGITTTSVPVPLPLPLTGIATATATATTNNNNNSNLFNLHPPQSVDSANNNNPLLSDIQIDLTDEEEDLFDLLRTVTADCNMKTTARVAGGWVRDKILASNNKNDDFFSHNTREGISNSSREEDDVFDTVQDQKKRVAAVAEAVATTTKAISKEEDLELTLQAIMKSPSTATLSSSPSSSSNNKRSIVDTPLTLSVTEHVDIDITLDDCYGSEFATELETYLSSNHAPTAYSHSVHCIISNPEQTQHLETATMRLNNYWIDFVNLRAEEYSEHPKSDSRIPHVMRIGTAVEDAQRRDLTINSLFYNIHTGEIEDMTGKGLNDLQKGIVDTPLTPLKTLLDDPLRVLRSVRFAARLHFDISDKLWEAASDPSVKVALARKVSRERIGSEVNLMLQSRHPARALELLLNLGLITTVFPKPTVQKNDVQHYDFRHFKGAYHEGLSLLSTTHDHLVDCMTNRPGWCEAKRALEAGAVNGLGKKETLPLMEDEEARRLLWYAAFLKPLYDRTKSSKEEGGTERKKSRKSKERSAIQKLLVDELKRPTKEAQSIEAIMKAADEFTHLISNGESECALAILLSGARVVVNKKQQLGIEEGEDRSMERRIVCTMDHHPVNPTSEDDPLWEHAMDFRQRSAKILKKVEYLWRAAFILSMCEQLVDLQTRQINRDDDELSDQVCEGTLREGWSQETDEEVVCSILKKYDVFAAAMLQLGLIGIWKQNPILDGGEIKAGGKKTDPILPNLPNGPEFRSVMDAQIQWMITHPGGSREALVEHIREEFPAYC